jgi:hypothetical protein
MDELDDDAEALTGALLVLVFRCDRSSRFKVAGGWWIDADDEVVAAALTDKVADNADDDGAVVEEDLASCLPADGLAAPFTSALSSGSNSGSQNLRIS